MSDKVAILYPSIAMALLTIAVVVSLGLRRYAAVNRREVHPKFYRTFFDGTETETLRQHGRHAQNQFEIPPLFHLAVWGTFIAGEVTPVAVGAAWLFVVLRVAHSFVHLTYNKVVHRFFVFGFSLFTLLFLWLRLLGTLAHA